MSCITARMTVYLKTFIHIIGLGEDFLKTTPSFVSIIVSLCLGLQLEQQFFGFVCFANVTRFKFGGCGEDGVGKQGAGDESLEI